MKFTVYLHMRKGASQKRINQLKKHSQCNGIRLYPESGMRALHAHNLQEAEANWLCSASQDFKVIDIVDMVEQPAKFSAAEADVIRTKIQEMRYVRSQS